MTNRVLTSGCLAAVVGAVAMAGLPVAGQTPAPKPAVPAAAVRPGVPKPAEGAKAAEDAVGRTGISRASGRATPLSASRASVPEKFGDRAVLTDEEFAEAREGRRAAPRRRRERRRRVPQRRRVEDEVVPPDVDRHRARGRPHARVHRRRRRRAPRRATAAASAKGPFDEPARLHALRSLHHARHRRLGACRSSTATATGSSRRRARSIISYEMVHDTRVIYTDGRPHICPRRSASISATRAATGKATRSSSRRRTSPTRRASAAATATGCATAPT